MAFAWWVDSPIKKEPHPNLELAAEGCEPLPVSVVGAVCSRQFINRRGIAASDCNCLIGKKMRADLMQASMLCRNMSHCPFNSINGQPHVLLSQFEQVELFKFGGIFQLYCPGFPILPGFMDQRSGCHAGVVLDPHAAGRAQPFIYLIDESITGGDMEDGIISCSLDFQVRFGQGVFVQCSRLGGMDKLNSPLVSLLSGRERPRADGCARRGIVSG